MSNYIGIETAEYGCSVAVARNGQVVWLKEFRQKNVTNEKLAAMTQQAVQETDLEHDAIQTVFIAAGPGSYTGLRIGFSFARGFVFAEQIPLIAIPTPEIWAYKYQIVGKSVLAVTDAHRGEVYFNSYQFRNSVPVAENEEIGVENAGKIAENYAGRDVLVCGSGVRILNAVKKMEDEPNNWQILPEKHTPVSAVDVLELGMELERQGLTGFYTLEEPLYVRDFKGAY